MDQNTHVDVLCVGLASYDLVFSVSEPPGEDDKMPASSFTQCGGGPAAHAALTCTRLGARPGIPFKADVELFLNSRSTKQG